LFGLKSPFLRPGPPHLRRDARRRGQGWPAISSHPKGLALTVPHTPPHSGCTGCHDFSTTISCLMICCLPFYSPQLLSSD